MDNKFEKLRALIPILVLNTTAAKEHVPEVESHICLIKKHGRGIGTPSHLTRCPRSCSSS
jgi:hypothetical protein